ncbi:hypothetical protein Ae201684P_016705 [Aphanomyces euteiches]|uniref:Myb/SANT-like domain-containing protein n=1 Tax=Aphanomyces euteiches TaxID=100861 RepID=A0A6G0XJE8_9STRA|nr:hypothetical protein Ae201684_004216 [Aphanomyces euteiches]KAH9094090.1 hypothetical protein Ae201684P_016705 [Aphanomyces euteiches]
MAMQTTAARAKWNAEKDAYLIKFLLRQKDAGKQSDSGFKKEAWTAILAKFNKHFSVVHDKEKIKTRHNQLKADWKLFQSLKDDSGFGWDAEKQRPTASDNVWEERMASATKPVQTKLKQIQRNGMDNQDALGELFGGTMAVGRFASSVGGLPDVSDGDIPPNSDESDCEHSLETATEYGEDISSPEQPQKKENRAIACQKHPWRCNCEIN